MSRLRGVYLLTPDESDTARLLERVEAALAGGAVLLQYRNKLADTALRLEQAQALLPLCRRHGVPLVINDSVELALAVGADGVHLGRDDGDIASARARLGAGRLLGVSCYGDWSRAEAAIAAGADQVAFGAMFPSPTKPAAPRAGPGLLTRARERGWCCAAIGGITLDNAPSLIAAGADLLALISDVFGAPDPAARVAGYRALFD